MGSTVRRKTAEISTVSQKVITPSGPSINIYVLFALVHEKFIYFLCIMCNTHTVFSPPKTVLYVLCPQKYINNFSIVPVSFILVLALGRKCFFIKS